MKKLIIITIIVVFLFIIVWPFIKMGVYFTKINANTEHLNFSNDRLFVSVIEDANDGVHYPYITILSEDKSEVTYLDKTYLWGEAYQKAYFIGYSKRYVLINLNDLSYVLESDLSSFSIEDQRIFEKMEKSDNIFITSEYIENCFKEKIYYDSKGRINLSGT